MIKKTVKIIEKLIMSLIILYTYNLLATPINLIIPINIMSITIIMICGTKSLFSLITILLLVY
ncbi:MAG: pro-sigmaK processing inhibitor BofA family protein [Mycoplasmatota bacterium]